MTSKAAVEKVFQLCQKYGADTTLKLLQREMGVEASILEKAINKLSKDKRISMYKKGQNVHIKVEISGNVPKFDASEDKVVYQVIKDCGDEGVSIKDIENRTNLKAEKIKKLLQKMEKLHQIKSFTQVNRGMKQYVLYNVEPSKNLVGGVFYTKSTIDTNFVETLRKVVLRHMSDKASKSQQSGNNDKEIYMDSLCTLDELLNVISRCVQKVKLTTKDVEELMYTLVVDDEVLCKGSQTKLYRIKHKTTKYPAMQYVPCLSCPYKNVCGDGGIISPDRCPYIKQWLDLDW